VYAAAGVGPDEVDVAEVHDAFASNELAMYEALGLCGTGEGGALIDSGEWAATAAGGELCRMPKRGRRAGSAGDGAWRDWLVVNPSGGLESKGHPVGATGLAQCAECCWQLRGAAGPRQVPGARIALQHNYGWASAAVVTLYASGGGAPTSRL